MKNADKTQKGRETHLNLRERQRERERGRER